MSAQEAVSVVSKKVAVSKLCCLCTGVSVCYVSFYNIKLLFVFHSSIWYFGLLLIFCIKSSLKTEKGEMLRSYKCGEKWKVYRDSMSPFELKNQEW